MAFGPVCLAFFVLLAVPAKAQVDADEEEISVLLDIQQLGTIEIPALIHKQEVYLSVTDMFDDLKIKVSSSKSFDSVSGFFINPSSPYLIDFPNRKITYHGKTLEVKATDMIHTGSDLFLKLNYFGDIFGLNCKFNFRSLTVTLATDIELPIIKEIRLELIRNNINRLRGEVRADTTIKRGYPAFHFGMTDWSVIGTQILNGPTDTRVNLGLGGIIAGGETDIGLNYSTNEPFTERQQQYLWRLANNDNRFVRQISAGKINAQATSSLYAPVVGAQVTNTPTTYRQSFGSYTLADYTQPGWTVELYVNNVIVDYKKADASGFFKFDVPLVYGNTEVKLRFYGPNGEEKSSEKTISIPFTFLPAKEFEYTVTGGIVEDHVGSRFAKANLNYGMSRRLTVGGGVEYLSSVTSGNTMPFVDFSLRLASSLLISGDYTLGVRWRGILSYRLPSNFQIDLNYSKYTQGQTAINFNYLEERKVILSYPIRGKNFSSYLRFTLDQIILPISQYTTAEFLLSGGFFGVSTNFTTYALFSNPGLPTVYSNLSLGFRLPKGFLLTPQAQYDYNLGQFISAKCQLEKRVFRKGSVNISYEQNFSSNISNTQVGFRYDFAFSQTSFLLRQTNNLTSFVESARGGIILDAKSNYFATNNSSNVSRGGIVIVSFLDYNCNGIRDKDEPKVNGLEIRMTGGSIEQNKKDSTIRVFNLEPYTSYVVELNRNSFDNISWKLLKPVMVVNIDPNQFKLIQVPISVVGEVSGMVYIKGDHARKGQGRIILRLYRNDSVLMAQTVSEPDGYFNYLGLPPGSYFATPDTNQLSRLNLNIFPESIPFTIKKSHDGDVVDDLEFTLSPGNEDLPPKVEQKTNVKENQEVSPPKIKKEEIKPVPPVQNLMGRYYIQVGSFRNESYAKAACNRLITKLNLTVEINFQDGFYKVQAVSTGIQEAQEILKKILAEGFSQAFIIKSSKP